MSMRFLATALIVGLLAMGANRAGAHEYCPFLAFCDAQQRHCHYSCGALTDVIAWPERPAFLAHCFAKCDAQFRRCAVRNTRRCLAWRR
jgi:hypothetical protein